MLIDYLEDDKISDWLKLKVFVDDKLISSKSRHWSLKGKGKLSEKRRKYRYVK